MAEIDRINDKMFKKIFKDEKNARDFLRRVLPQQIKSRLDFSTVTIDPTNHVSNEFNEGYSDIVVGAKMKGRGGKSIPTDIYFVLEHKTDGKVKVFFQVLKYMCFIWEQDINEGKPLRIIIPVVFYHGKKKWKVPDSFVDQFDVDDEIKQFLLNFRYILFDTNPWNFRDESNEELKNNVFLFTAMALMKAAFAKDTETIHEIFNFWHKKGFTENKENIQFFLAYIYHTRQINQEQLKKMLDESKIDGGEIMQTLAQQLRNEGRKIGKNEGIKIGETIGEKRGEKKAKIQTAQNLLDLGIDIEKISKATGLEIEEIKKLSSSKTYH